MTRLVAISTLTLTALIGLPEGSAQAQTSDTCNLAAMDGVVGQTSAFATNLINDLQEYASDQIVQFLLPGENPEDVDMRRLTVVFGGDGKVTRAYCG